MIEYDRTNEFIISKKTFNELHQILKKKIINNYMFKIPPTYTGGAFNTDFDGDELYSYIPLTQPQLSAFHHPSIHENISLLNEID